MSGGHGPVVLITGGRRGIGRAVAGRFLEAGWRVALNDVDATGLMETVDSLPSRLVTAHPADVGNRQQVSAMFDEVYAAHGRLDAIVVNAGVMRFAPFIEYSESDFEATVGTNLTGAFHCCQAAARRWMEEGTGGSIVIISSISAHQARPGHVAYGASKAGVEQLARVAAMELGPHGIRVNCVAPGGPIMTEAVQPLSGRPGFDERVRTSVPLGRVGRAEEVAGITYFLSTEEASYLTGAVVVVDGGVSLGRP